MQIRDLDVFTIAGWRSPPVVIGWSLLLPRLPAGPRQEGRRGWWWCPAQHARGAPHCQLWRVVRSFHADDDDGVTELARGACREAPEETSRASSRTRRTEVVGAVADSQVTGSSLHVGKLLQR
jgi:hypothetical protein